MKSRFFCCLLHLLLCQLLLSQQGRQQYRVLYLSPNRVQLEQLVVNMPVTQSATADRSDTRFLFGFVRTYTFTFVNIFRKGLTFYNKLHSLLCISQSSSPSKLGELRRLLSWFRLSCSWSVSRSETGKSCFPGPLRTKEHF